MSAVLHPHDHAHGHDHDRQLVYMANNININMNNINAGNNVEPADTIYMYAYTSLHAAANAFIAPHPLALSDVSLLSLTADHSLNDHIDHWHGGVLWWWWCLGSRSFEVPQVQYAS